mmetsp:Transcript_41583/g.125610  ORF Transcript_41583/g.125610 Transcript_41583/m.125610 type:complete len:236 (+) Transcript_41583:1542-2249(+)
MGARDDRPRLARDAHRQPHRLQGPRAHGPVPARGERCGPIGSQGGADPDEVISAAHDAGAADAREQGPLAGSHMRLVRGIPAHLRRGVHQPQVVRHVGGRLGAARPVVPVGGGVASPRPDDFATDGRRFRLGVPGVLGDSLPARSPGLRAGRLVLPRGHARPRQGPVLQLRRVPRAHAPRARGRSCRTASGLVRVHDASPQSHGPELGRGVGEAPCLRRPGQLPLRVAGKRRLAQ